MMKAADAHVVSVTIICPIDRTVNTIPDPQFDTDGEDVILVDGCGCGAIHEIDFISFLPTTNCVP